jgi:SAM-dependent methyltransferase
VTGPAAGEPYLLAVGEAAASRLQLLDEAYGPFTRAFLDRAGLALGMSVLDVGCGSGSLSLWLAERVGPHGRVLGVDDSPDQVAVARGRAEARGLGQVEFRALAAEALDRLDERFDLVFARFLLVHVAEPEAVLRAMLERVRPGGLLACDEQELAAACCLPPAQAFTDSVALAFRASRAKGLDYDFGARLFALFTELGCEDVRLGVVQPALTGPAKRLWPLFFRESGPNLVAQGDTTETELAALIAGLDAVVADPRAVVLPMRNHQVLGRRPSG